MEYLFALNLIAHSPIKRFRWFGFDPTSLVTLISRRNRCIKLCAARIDVARAYRKCLKPSNAGLVVDRQICSHVGVSASTHDTVVQNAEDEVDYLSQKIDQLGNSIEPLQRVAFGL